VTLTPWLAAALDAAGADPGVGLVGDDAIAVVLDLARDAAHEIERPAAPVSTFALGFALGQAGGDLDKLRGLAAAIAAAAAGFDQEVAQ
jgi:hypothetical protein